MVQNRLRGIVAYMGTGHGFKSPAVAIQKALEERGIEVECVDLFQEIGELSMDNMVKKGWEFYLHQPWSFRLTFALADTPLVHLAQSWSSGRVKKSLYTYLRDKQPDFIISTHFVTTAAVAKVLKKHPMPIAFFGYNSDVILSHQAYIAKSVYRYYVATEKGREHMVEQGMADEKVSLTSFPLDSKFRKQFGTVAEERAKLGLEDKFTILLTFGGLGIGSYNLIEKLAQSGMDIQVVTICGRNEKMVRDLQALKAKYPRFSLNIQGFVANMQDFLYTCDISAGKSGLNMVFESMYMKKPFLVLMAMANERFAARFVVENGFGWYPKGGPEEMLAVIRRAYEDPSFTKPIHETLLQQPYRYETGETAALIEQDTEQYKAELLASRPALFFDLAGTLCDIPIGNIWEEINLSGIRAVLKDLEVGTDMSEQEFESLCRDFVDRKAVLRKEAKTSLREFDIRTQIRDFLLAKADSLPEAADVSRRLPLSSPDWSRIESIFVKPELDITVPFEGAREVLQELAKGYDLYLLSNNASTNLVYEIADKLGIRELFRKIYVSADIGYRKPDMRFLMAVLKDTRLKARDAVMIGDRLAQDTWMANEADMPSVFCAMVDHADNRGAEHTSYTAMISKLTELESLFPRRQR